MIGVFDSGLWGVQTLQYLRASLPEHNFCYLGDTAHVPYGEKSGEWIRDRTFQCLEWLFAQGCHIVIMACNTASAFALREWQETFPDRKVLSVTVPGVEAIVSWNFHAPLLLATKVTIETHIYELVRLRAFPDYAIDRYTQIGTGRVDALEKWASDADMYMLIEATHVERFVALIDCVVLWCTHYPLLQEHIERILPGIPIIDPAHESAQQLVSYLDRHPEITSVCRKDGHTSLWVTWSVEQFSERIGSLWWLNLPVSQTSF